ncbi:MAG: DUF924 family protein, partial [Phycisphaerales bacterium]|nr:DUF924 family protein [Phycisphaerales bacterium]
MSSASHDPIDILSYWWEAGPDKWFEADKTFDDDIRSRFLVLYEAAFAGSLDHWTETPHGALALILVLD